MKSDPDKLLNQLVVAALTVFIVVILLLAALVWRQLWLQQHIANLSTDVQSSLSDLEEITEDIQRELAEQQSSAGGPDRDGWQDVTEALEGVDEQLDLLEDDLNEVVQALEPQAEPTSALAGREGELPPVQDQVDHVFTLFAVLVGAASIFVAILLGIAVRVQAGRA